MESRFEVLNSYAKDKEDSLKLLEEVTLKAFNRNDISEKRLKFIIQEAYQLGHYVGHIRGEQYQSDLLESYKKELYEADEWRAAHEQ